ncbi:ATP-binding protein [Desulforhabdus sp. TSK]|uniref:ATP-binding protein n=1 Tax=Desulforhabdus sp. TSK TaxID=2925014 RepID=UPI001FC8210E|nr:ATP-binding protein [Desulforhabdus sp. TSK]GKT09768.1 hypothetical protein DSTSK_30730 [Desulforhabdus sp. TSK]
MFLIKTKISRRFFASLMFLTVIPVGIMGYVTYLLAERALTQTAFQHMTTIAEDHAQHLDAWIRERLDDLRLLSRMPTIRDACRDFCWIDDLNRSPENYLTLLNGAIVTTRARSPSYDSISIVLPSGKILTSSRGTVSDVNSDSECTLVLHRMQEGEDTAFGPIYPHDNKSWKMDLVARVRSESGETVAFIVAVLDVSKTIEPLMTDRIGLGWTGETYLVNKDGRMISPSRFLGRDETFSRNLDTYGVRQALLRQKGTAIYENYTGSTVMGAFLWLPSYEWAILAEMSLDEILRPLQWIKTLGVATGLLVMAVCLVPAYVLSRRVAKPIIEVAYAARRLAEGELDRRIHFSSGDEVGVLAQSFNIMAHQLSQSITTLRRKEESLQKAYNELMAMQAQLVQSEKMAAIGELVASVAHEMRNPLSSVKLNVQILGRSLTLDSVLYEHYAIALHQVAQMEKMFSDLLNYSRPLILQVSPVSMQELLKNCLQSMDQDFLTRRIEVRMNTSGSLPLVMIDSDKIQQVLSNVLRNAIEASVEGGAIEVSLSVSTTENQEYVVITVADHGAGIAQRHLKTVFQPFFTTKQKGTGLGLCIVKKIVDAHGGEIELTSEEGRGTTVKLAFPLPGGNR